MGRGRFPLWVLVSVLLLAWSAGSVALGDDAHGGGAAKKPNIFEPALDLGIWTVVVFVVLLLVLRKMAWKPMLEGLHKREQSIHGAIEEARRDREEAERLRQQLQAELAKAHEQVSAIIEQGRQTTQRTTEEMIAKARADIQGERDRQRREIEMARDQALQELWNQTAQLATLVSAKTLRRELNPEDQRRLVDEAIVELRQTGNGKQHA